MSIKEAKSRLESAVGKHKNGHVRAAYVTDAIQALIRAVVEDLMSRPICTAYIIRFPVDGAYNCNKPEGHTGSHRCGAITWEDP